MKYSLIIAAAMTAALTVAGCSPQKKSTVHCIDEPVNLATPAGIGQYLTKLPAVENVSNWENEFAPGVTITTKHYEIHTTLLEPLLLNRVPCFMESAYLAYQKQLPSPISSDIKYKIYLFGDRSQWEEFTKEIAGENSHLYLKIKKGAYYLNGVCVAYDIGRDRTLSVLAHEGWHQFNSRHFAYRLPSWLDEGIATMFESTTVDKTGYNFDPAYNLGRLGSLRKMLLSGKIIPLEKLISLNPGEVVAHADTEAVMAFYAQSYALIRFLREEGYGRHLDKYHNLLLGACNGTWPLDESLEKVACDRNIPLTANWNRHVSPKLFSSYISEDYNKMHAEYAAFCKKIARTVRLK